jgi:hypothetical protein
MVLAMWQSSWLTPARSRQVVVLEAAASPVRPASSPCGEDKLVDYKVRSHITMKTRGGEDFLFNLDVYLKG